MGDSCLLVERRVVAPTDLLTVGEHIGQPDAMVPISEKSPMTETRPAAMVTPMPWSCAAGTKCVHIMPLVVAPHTAKLPARIQNCRSFSEVRNTLMVRAAALRSATGFGTKAVAP